MASVRSHGTTTPASPRNGVRSSMQSRALAVRGGQHLAQGAQPSDSRVVASVRPSGGDLTTTGITDPAPAYVVMVSADGVPRDKEVHLRCTPGWRAAATAP